MNKPEIYILGTPYVDLSFVNFCDAVKAAAVACSYSAGAPIMPDELIDDIRDCIASKGEWLSGDYSISVSDYWRK